MTAKAQYAFRSKEEMEVSDNEDLMIPFGMFELDAAGLIVHYSPVSEEGRAALQNKMVGRNFFDDLGSFSQVEELRRRFLNFMSVGTSVERFSINFNRNLESVRVQIVMARFSEKSERGRESFALIRLMPERIEHLSSNAAA
jgi:hypothetical protein